MRFRDGLSSIGFLLVFLAVGAVQAQTAEDEIELTRSVIQTERKAIVSENMSLTEEEASKFWPIFNSYQNEMRKVNDRLVTVIKKYADGYNNNSIDEPTARVLIKDYLAVEKNKLKVKEKYLTRFNEVLPPVKVVRFYQVENKLDTVVNAGLAQEIPLAR